MRNSLLLFILPLFWCAPAFAHPIDLGAMNMQILGERILLTLKLHVVAVEHFTGQRVPADSEKLSAFAPTLLAATIGPSPPTLGGDLCRWKSPELHFADAQKQSVDFTVVALCTQAKLNAFGLDFPMPFLERATPSFQLIARVEGRGEPLTLVANARKPRIEFGARETKSFLGFLHMGWAHIGALPEEWRTNDGAFRFPEGLDHIFFVIALVLGGGTVLGIFKSVTGFTLGHSITLGLSTLKIIHVHSHWIEALIALSIAYVAGAALFKPRAAHRWVVASIFGTVHGLGFASALQELNLSRGEVLPALFGFNLGVEVGQCVIILLTLPVLMAIERFFPKAYVWVHRVLALALFLIGSYWFVIRAIN